MNCNPVNCADAVMFVFSQRCYIETGSLEAFGEYGDVIEYSNRNNIPDINLHSSSRAYVDLIFVHIGQLLTLDLETGILSQENVL